MKWLKIRTKLLHKPRGSDIVVQPFFWSMTHKSQSSHDPKDCGMWVRAKEERVLLASVVGVHTGAEQFQRL